MSIFKPQTHGGIESRPLHTHVLTWKNIVPDMFVVLAVVLIFVMALKVFSSQEVAFADFVRSLQSQRQIQDRAAAVNASAEDKAQLSAV